MEASGTFPITIPLRSPHIAFDNDGKNFCKEYPPIARDRSENEPQTTRLLIRQILPFPATGASQQDVGGIRKVRQCWCCIFKFYKTFNKADHGTLLNKLKKSAFNGKVGVWMHNFLSNKQQCVAVNRTTSSEAKVRCDVVQGTVLGTILFLIHTVFLI